MESMLFDRLARTIATPGSRRGLLAGLCAVAMPGLITGHFNLEMEAASRQHRNARSVATRHRDVHQQGKRKKKCAKAGQTPKRGRRCCQGLGDDGSGRCSVPNSAPTPPRDSGGSTCQSCSGATPICDGGTCVACTADAQCVAAGSGARCCNGKCQACCDAADCPSPQCQSCQHGTCVATNAGQICGTSTTSGDPIRCCNGSCP